MSIYLATTSDYLSRNTGLLPVTAAHTVMVWVRNRSSVATTRNTAYASLDAHPYSTDQAGLFTQATTNRAEFNAERSGGFFDNVDTSLGSTTNQWFHICYTSNGNATNNVNLFVNGQWIGGVPSTFNFASFVKNLEVIGNNGFDTTADHDFVYFRAWSAALTSIQIVTEMQSVSAVRTANLWMDTPLETDLLDISGNGRNWTLNGSGTFTPYNPFPDNSGYLTAQDVPYLPYTLTGVSADENGVVFDLWYKYTATYSGALGVFPTGSAGYTPRIIAYTLVAGVITTYPQPNPVQGSDNCPVQIGVELGKTYYIKVDPDGSTTIPSTLDINFLQSPNKTVAEGSLLVIDDTNNYPTTIISAANGDNYNVLRFIEPPLASGEGGDVLPNRVLFVTDTQSSSLSLYDNTLALVSTISYTKSTGASLTYVKANRITNVFWTLDKNNSNPPKASKFTTEGVLVTSFNVGAIQLRAFAPNSDDTILYIGNTSGAVKQWNIAGAAYGADLVAAISGFQVEDLLLLTDGTILVYYTRISGGADESFVKRYNSSGTTLNTYTVESSGSWTRVSNSYYLTSALDDPTSFWVVSHRYGTDNFDMFGVFKNVKLSDGTVLATVQYVEFSRGRYQLESDLPPLARFGPSPSCPYIILRAGLTPPAGSSTLTVIKETDPPGSSQTFVVNVGGDVDTPVLNMQDGDSHVYSDLAEGIYTVAEEVPQGWAVTYVVDNGDSPSEIHIFDGDNVTVTITNTRLPGGFAENALSGIYKIEPGKRNETLWESFDPERKKLVKIPDPFVESGLLGE